MLFKNILLGKNANTYKGGLGGVLSPGLAQCHDCHHAQAQSWLLHQPLLLLPFLCDSEANLRDHVILPRCPNTLGFYI